MPKTRNEPEPAVLAATLGHSRAEFAGGEWRSSEPALAALLNRVTAIAYPGPSDPAPLKTLARKIQKTTGAKVEILRPGQEDAGAADAAGRDGDRLVVY